MSTDRNVLDLVTTEGLASKTEDVARVLRALSNPRRLHILCELSMRGEANVTALAEAIGLSQSALSQHLSIMREEALVAFRRDAQTLYYHISDPKIASILSLLHDLYCRPGGG
jgi:ArsR family transcriptional regulator